MKVKKFLAFFLILTMLVSMVACAGEETKEEVKDTAAKNTTELPDTTQSEELTEDTTEAPSEETGILNGIVGSYKGNHYENAYIGISCDLSAEWSVKSESEIAELLGLTQDLFDDTAISEIIETSGAACVYMATGPDGSSVNIMLEKNPASNRIQDAEDYVDAAWAGLELTLKDAGFENLLLDRVTVEFAGEETVAISIEADFGGMKIYEVIVPLVFETCIAAVTVASINENSCETILSYFEAVTY